MPAESSSGSMSQSGAEAPASASATPGAVAIGVKVEGESGESLGTVTDIVADPTTGAPLFVVISTQGQTTAMPYAAASSMLQTDVIVVESAKLAAAPRVEQSDLHEPSAAWTGAANDYWGQGEMRTASPDPGATSDSGSDQSASEPAPEEKPRG
jgi:hypothetical protein